MSREGCINGYVVKGVELLHAYTSQWYIYDVRQGQC